MRAVSRGFSAASDRDGLVIGVLPSDPTDVGKPKRGYPNDFVELAIRTHLPLSGRDGTDLRSRNHINVLSADAVVILPGGPGTRSEAELVVAYGRPAIGFTNLDATMDWPQGLIVSTDLEEVVAFVTSVAPTRGP